MNHNTKKDQKDFPTDYDFTKETCIYINYNNYIIIYSVDPIRTVHDSSTCYVHVVCYVQQPDLLLPPPGVLLSGSVSLLSSVSGVELCAFTCGVCVGGCVCV